MITVLIYTFPLVKIVTILHIYTQHLIHCNLVFITILLLCKHYKLILTTMLIIERYFNYHETNKKLF